MAMTPNSDTAENLVLGTAFGYTAEQVRIFVESLRRYYSGPVMLLVNSRDSTGLLAYLASQRVTPVFYDCALWMDGHISVTRYIRYGEVLRAAPGRYARVLLTDVRDVFFQADPFRNAPEGELLCYLEVEGRIVAHCPANTQWIQQIFGTEELLKMAQRDISCSGTTFGTAEAILDYIDKMLAYATPEMLTSLRECSGHRHGHDQGIHNYLLRNGMLPKARTVPNGVHVFTVGLVSKVQLAPGGQILTQEGVLCPIVHQYTYQLHMHHHVCAAYPPPLRAKSKTGGVR